MLREGQLAAFIPAHTSTKYSNYSFSFVSFLCYPSRVKLYSGTAEISWTFLLQRVKQHLFSSEHILLPTFCMWEKAMFEKQGAKPAQCSVQQAELESSSPKCSKSQICL